MRRPDAHRALIRALVGRYPGLLVLSSRSEPWASITFTGARHVLFCGRGVEVGGIAEEEFQLHSHVVADIAARDDGAALVIEALTIETD